MKTVFFSLAFLFISTVSFSQARAKEMKDDPIIKERISNGGVRIKADMRVSEYFGLEQKIQEVMISNSIPSDCPKSIGYADKALYIKDLNAWIKENPSNIKEEKKNTLISE